MGKDSFRRLALAFKGAEEKSHFGKADFRVKNKIFAGFTAEGKGYVKLTAEQQEMMAAAEPKIIQPIKGGWGRQGWTEINLENADEALLKSALTTAWRNVAPKSMRA
jgi:hypothetical protein